MGSSLSQRRTCSQVVNQGVKQSLLYQAFQDVPSLRPPKGTWPILHVIRPIWYDSGHFVLGVDVSGLFIIHLSCHDSTK